MLIPVDQVVIALAAPLASYLGATVILYDREEAARAAALARMRAMADLSLLVILEAAGDGWPGPDARAALSAQGIVIEMVSYGDLFELADKLATSLATRKLLDTYLLCSGNRDNPALLRAVRDALSQPQIDALAALEDRAQQRLPIDLAALERCIQTVDSGLPRRCFANLARSGPDDLGYYSSPAYLPMVTPHVVLASLSQDEPAGLFAASNYAAATLAPLLLLRAAERSAVEEFFERSARSTLRQKRRTRRPPVLPAASQRCARAFAPAWGTLRSVRSKRCRRSISV